MNVRVHRAVSDIDGVTGMAILRAIVAGEPDAQKLAKLRDRRCSKIEQEIAEQLSGHWLEDHLFSLQQALKMYDAVQERIAAYEKEMLRKLGDMERDEHHGRTAPPLPNPNKAKMIKYRGQEAKRRALYPMSGVDASRGCSDRFHRFRSSARSSSL
jgi:transposase